MQAITTIGLDIAKSVFQVHGVDADGQVVIRRQLKRRYVLTFFQKLPPCLVGIEACASSMRSALTLPSLALWRRSAATVSISSSVLSLIQKTSGCPSLHVRVLRLSVPN
jgi:hypothetical protein